MDQVDQEKYPGLHIGIPTIEEIKKFFDKPPNTPKTAASNVFEAFDFESSPELSDSFQELLYQKKKNHENSRHLNRRTYVIKKHELKIFSPLLMEEKEEEIRPSINVTKTRPHYSTTLSSPYEEIGSPFVLDDNNNNNIEKEKSDNSIDRRSPTFFSLF